MIIIIDKVVLKNQVHIDIQRLSRPHWIKCKYKSKFNPSVDNIYYIRKLKNVSFIYHVNKNVLRVKGRFINLSQVANRVYNLDELYAGQLELWFEEVNHDDEHTVGYQDSAGNWHLYVVDYYPDLTPHGYAEDLNDVLNSINTFLYQSTGINMDIRGFKVEHIEACFNLSTTTVSQYITLMNKIFHRKGDPRYVNHTIICRLGLHTSCYIKTRREYRKNTKQNYTVNFYNKLDQLIYAKATNYYGAADKIIDQDFELAENVLRLEVQVNYHYLTKIYKKYGMDLTLRAFIDMLDIDLCAGIIKDKYGYFMDRQMYLGFYSYKAAKTIIKNSFLSPTVKKNLLKKLYKWSKGNKMTDKELQNYKHRLAQLGIHYYLIPSNMNIDYLPSPMKLLDERVAECKRRREEFLKEEDWEDFTGYHNNLLRQKKIL